MKSFSTVTVINVKKQRRNSKKLHRNEVTNPSIIRVTRVKSCSREAFKKDRASVSTVNASDMSMVHVNVSRTNSHSNTTTPTKIQRLNNDVKRYQFSHSIAGENYHTSTNNVALPVLNNFSRKVRPAMNDYDRLQSTSSSSLNSVPTKKQIKSKRFSFGNRQELYTIGKDDMKKRRCCKSRLSCSSRRALLLAILASLCLVIVAVIPATIMTLKKAAATTTTISTSSTSTSSTGPPTGTSTSLSTLIVTTSTTTDSTTTVSTTSGAATVTITSNICTSSITGIQIVASCSPCGTINFYYQYIYNYTAIANVTRLALGVHSATLFFALDSISVQDYAVLGVELLVNGGFETGDLTSWVYCNQNNVSSTGGVKSNFTYGGYTYFYQSAPYYYVGGSNVSIDYISQAFPTKIGHTYRVTLWVMYPGSGNSSSADFFLGV